MTAVTPAAAAAAVPAAPGGDVYGTCDGSFAPYARARANRLASKPANLSFEQAAAVPVSALTALQAVRGQAQVQAGQKVLVIGAFPLVSQKPSTIMASENSASIEGARTWNSPVAG